MEILKVSAVSKKLQGNEVLKNVSFVLPYLKKLAIAGETGSGKSSLLKIIGGWLQKDSGEVHFENKYVPGPEEKLLPGHAKIAYLSQQFELPNNYQVDNVLEYANQLSIVDANEIFEICRINHLLQRLTSQLSGGERQRIALAKLLVAAPKLLLLDEPFSNLDIIHKAILKQVIHDISARLQITCILVSHDPLDILSWADIVIVMQQGVIVQQGSPVHLYRQPANEYVAALLGNYNLLTPDNYAEIFAVPGVRTIKKSLLLRPEWILAEKTGSGAQGKIKNVTYYGNYKQLIVVAKSQQLLINTTRNDFAIGDSVFLSITPENAWYL